MKIRKFFPLLPITFSMLSVVSHGALVVGGFNGDRIGITSLSDGFVAEDARLSIASAFPGVTFVGTDLLSASFLNTVDCLIIGAPHVDGVTYLSPEEQINLLKYVKAGGGLLIITDNDEHAGKPQSDNAAETFFDPFGVDGVGHIGGLQKVSPVDPSHRLFDGPFGQVASISTYFSGWFDGFGPYAVPVARYDESSEAAVLAIAPDTLASGSGGVVFIGDGQVLLGADFGGTLKVDDTETFLHNAIAYVIPEPSVALAGIFGLGILASRRRRRV